MPPSTFQPFITSSYPPCFCQQSAVQAFSHGGPGSGDRVILLLQVNVTGTGRNHGTQCQPPSCLASPRDSYINLAPPRVSRINLASPRASRILCLPRHSSASHCLVRVSIASPGPGCWARGAVQSLHQLLPRPLSLSQSTPFFSLPHYC